MKNMLIIEDPYIKKRKVRVLGVSNSKNPINRKFKTNLIRTILLILSCFFVSCQSDPGNSQSWANQDFRFLEKDITEIQQGYQDGLYTIKEVTQAYLDRINEMDKDGPALNSIIQVNPDALQIAEAVDDKMARNVKNAAICLGTLTGIDFSGGCISMNQYM